MARRPRALFPGVDEVEEFYGISLERDTVVMWPEEKTTSVEIPISVLIELYGLPENFLKRLHTQSPEMEEEKQQPKEQLQRVQQHQKFYQQQLRRQRRRQQQQQQRRRRLRQWQQRWRQQQQQQVQQTPLVLCPTYATTTVTTTTITTSRNPRPTFDFFPAIIIG